MFIRAYLRASTDKQNADRARTDLQAFADERGLVIAAWYVENESGASLKRPELFKLIEDAHEGDSLLIEQVDRLSRLNAADWQTLRAKLAMKRIKVIALDLPTSHMLLDANDFTGRMFEALNSMMLDMLAAISRKDYEDRRRRAQQAINSIMADPTKRAEKYKGKPEDARRHATIRTLLIAKTPWSDIMRDVGCSRMTVAKVARRLKEAG